jgi:hypothetical protein
MHDFAKELDGEDDEIIHQDLYKNGHAL